MDIITDKQLILNTFKCETENIEFAKLVADHMMYGNQTSINFISEYFNSFFLLFKLGKSIYQKYHHNNTTEMKTTIQIEYLSTLFAKTYLEYKNETEYLQRIKSRASMLVKMHKNQSLTGIDEQYMIYQQQRDFKTYAAFHFGVVCKSFEKTVTLDTIIKLISNGAYNNINHSILQRKDLYGIELVHECLQTVIELNDNVPEVIIDYSDFFNTINLAENKVFA